MTKVRRQKTDEKHTKKNRPTIFCPLYSVLDSAELVAGCPLSSDLLEGSSGAHFFLNCGQGGTGVIHSGNHHSIGQHAQEFGRF